MSAKNNDAKGRWRNVTVAFRVSPEENEEINMRAKLSGFQTKQEFIVPKFDGKDGTLAYVVINGRVYDVTSIKQWFNGKHYGLTAGKDLTEYFNSCHKSEKNILKKLKIVGKVENG